MNTSPRRLLIAAGLTCTLLATAAVGTNAVATAAEETTTVPAPAAEPCAPPESPSTTVAATTETTAAATPETTAAPTAETTAAPAPAAGQLSGSGATFPKVFYQEAMTSFAEKNPNVKISYGGGGSGKGRQDLADQIVQWAGTDGVVKDADKGKFKGGEFLYFPTVVAPITISYNLDAETVKLSPATIAKIFQREITNWNDPAIAADNGGTALADQAITVVRRADSSGTTGNFTKFLEKAVGAEGGCVWKLGTDSTVEWPADTQAGEGNSGVAQIVSSTPGAIGYVDLADATDAKLKIAEVQNKAGKFVKASVESATAAAAGTKVKDDLTFSTVWADGDDAYPITAQTWIIVYKKQSDKQVGENLKTFLTYILTDAQKLAPELGFAPLPEELQKKAVEQLDKLEIG